MNDFHQNDQNVGHQNNAGRDVSYYLNHPFAAVRELVVNVSNLFQGTFPESEPNYLSASKLRDYQQAIVDIKYEELELRKRCSEDDNSYRMQIFQLEQRKIALEREKLEYEKEVVIEKLELTRSYYAEDITLKKRELQDENDYRYSNLQVSRSSVLEILSQKSGDFILIPSPPKILCDDLPASKSFGAEIAHNIELYIEEKYTESAYTGVICENIFRGSIDKLVALDVGRFIAPIPTLILHAEVTHEKILMQVTITCPEINDNLQSSDLDIDLQADDLQTQFSSKFTPKNYQKRLPELNWRAYKKSLENQEKSSEEISQAILDMFSAAHLVVALCFCDLYCFQLNPAHQPQLFEFLLSSNFPDFLQPWANNFQLNLEEVQNQIQEEINNYEAVQAESQRFSYSGTSYDSESFNFGQIATFGVGAFLLLLLISMCSQPVSNTRTNSTNKDNVNSSEGLFIIVKNDLNANIRTGPSDIYPVILTVPPGFETSVRSIDETSGWIEIDMTQHHPIYQTGWVFGNNVDLYQTR
jgi:hypothetical protein